jgi:hypothetical protein
MQHPSLDAVCDILLGLVVVAVALILDTPLILSSEARRESRRELEGEDGNGRAQP